MYNDYNVISVASVMAAVAFLIRLPAVFCDTSYCAHVFVNVTAVPLSQTSVQTSVQQSSWFYLSSYLARMKQFLPQALVQSKIVLCW